MSIPVSFSAMVSDNFEPRLAEKNYEEMAMFLHLTAIREHEIETEMIKYYQNNPESSLKQLCEKSEELFAEKYPNGYNEAEEP